MIRNQKNRLDRLDSTEEKKWMKFFTKRRKRFVCMFCIMVVVVTSIPLKTVKAVTDGETSEHGFGYDDKVYDIKWYPKKTVKVYTGKKKDPEYLVAIVKVYIGRARYKTKEKNYIDTFMVKMEVNPQDAIKKGTSSTGYKYKYKVYGFCKQLSLKCTMVDDMIAYSPETQPEDTEYTLSAGASVGNLGSKSTAIGGANVSAATKIIKSALTFNFDKMNPAKNKFNLIYQYHPSYNPFGKKRNKYLLNTNTQRATMTMKTKKKHYTMKFKLKLKVGYASNKSGSGASTFTILDGATGSRTIKIVY